MCDRHLVRAGKTRLAAAGSCYANTFSGLRTDQSFRVVGKSEVKDAKRVYEDSTHLLSLAKSRQRAITVVALSLPVPFRLFFVRWI